MMNPLKSHEKNSLNCLHVNKYAKLWRRTRYVSFLTSLRPSSQCSASDEVAQAPPAPSNSRPRDRWLLCKSVVIFISVTRLSSPTGQNEGHHVINIPRQTESDTSHQGEEDERKSHLLQEIHCMMKEKDLQKLKQLGGVEGVSRIYGTNLEMGLDGFQNPWDETQIIFKAKSFWFYFYMACSSYTIFLLLASATLSMFLGIMEEGPKYGWDEGAAILTYTFLLVSIPSMVNFYHARRKEAELLEKDQREIHVLRDGEIRKVSVFDIKEGDVICLRQGDRVPADGLYIHGGENMVLDSASYNETSNDRDPFIWFGSKVTQGSGWMLVIFKRNKTDLHRIIGSVRNYYIKEKLFQIHIQEPVECMEKIKLFLSVLIMFVLLLRFVGGEDDDEKESPEFKGKVTLQTQMRILKAVVVPQGRIKILTSFSAAMVISIQHGMPFAYTISVYWWNHKLYLNGVIVENISACGTMGFVTAIVFDVSSRLTCKQVEFEKFYIGDEEIKDEDESTASQSAFDSLREGFRASLLHEFSHTPVDESLFSWLKEKWGTTIETNMQIIDSKPLESNFSDCHGVLITELGDDGMEKMHLHWRGAASKILPMCSHYQDAQGNNQLMDDESRNCFERRIMKEEGSGLMPLAFAYKKSQAQLLEESELILSAILFFKYNCREGIESAISALKTANIAIKLVVEDDLMLAKSIAHSFGAYEQGNNDKIIEAAKFRDLTEGGRKRKVNQIEMIAGCLPKDKVQLIKSLKQRKHVVAFIEGASISDVEAMVEADVGIGIREEMQITELASEISDIILGSYTLIQLIVQYGRNMYFNIQKLIQFELTAAIAGLFIGSFFTMVYGDSPLTAFQLIWMNILMFILGLPMLLMKLPDQMLNLIKTEPPRDASAVTKRIRREITAQVVYQIIAVLVLYYAGPSLADDGRIIKPMISNCFILCQILHVSTVLKLQKTQMLRNYSYLGALAGVLAIQVLLVQSVTSLAFYVKLNGAQWALCFFLTIPCVIIDWVIRYIIYLLPRMLECSRSC